MGLISNTGVPQKQSGDGLSHKDINNINSTVNTAVNAINEDLKNFCNLNQEANNYTRSFTLKEAIKAVPIDRRKQGMKIKYLSSTGTYKEYIFCLGKTTFSTEEWEDTENWMLPFNEIDGGEWELDDDFKIRGRK